MNFIKTYVTRIECRNRVFLIDKVFVIEIFWDKNFNTKHIKRVKSNKISFSLTKKEEEEDALPNGNQNDSVGSVHVCQFTDKIFLNCLRMSKHQNPSVSYNKMRKQNEILTKAAHECNERCFNIIYCIKLYFSDVFP